MKALITAIAVCISAPAAAQACVERDRLAVRLYETTDLKLVSWGLTEAGHMHELFMGTTGEWAIIETRANHCASVISAPTHHFERLNELSTDNRMMRRQAPCAGEAGSKAESPPAWHGSQRQQSD